jgi:hypothetical protein
MKLSLILLFIFGTLFLNVNGECANKYGCWKSKCWAGCRNEKGAGTCFVKDSIKDENIACKSDGDCRKFRCNVCNSACI